MADRTQYLEYAVYMTDKDEAERYQAAYPNGVNVAPQTIATQLSYPLIAHSITTPHQAPSVRSAYFNPNFAGTKYPLDQATFTKCRGGWFGICFLFGRTTTYKWVAKFYYETVPEAEDEGEPLPPEAISQLSWADGFEVPRIGTWSNTTLPYTRAASRHVDGYGFAGRGLEAGESRSHLTNENGAAARSRSWERIYICPRTAPSSADLVWRTISGGAFPGCALAILPGLNLAVYNIDNANGATLINNSTLTMELDVWHRVDMLIEFGPIGRFRIFVNSVLWLDVTAPASVGLGASVNHVNSELGRVYTNWTGAYDFDDWTNAPIPATFNGVDWLNGTKCVLAQPYTLGPTNNWTGDIRSILRTTLNANFGSLGLTSTTSGAVLETTLDAEYTINSQVGSKGAIGVTAHLARSTSNGAGQLGYDVAGAGVFTNTALVEPVAGAHEHSSFMYRPSGLTEAIETITPIKLRYQRGAYVNSTTLFRINAEVVLIGTFGNEDVREEDIGTPEGIAPPRLGPHCSRYPRSIWARQEIPPTAPVIVVGGTYVGNGTGQDLTFRAPVVYFTSRRAAGSGNEAGTWMWTSMMQSHLGITTGQVPYGCMEAREDYTFQGVGGDDDPEEQYLVRIGGGDATSNESGVTYQYIAFIDPGARFALNGGLSQRDNVASAVHALKKPTFLPQGVFYYKEAQTDGTTAAAFFKAPGNAATGASRYATGELANEMTIAEGSLTTFAGSGHTPDGTHIAYGAWRVDDLSGDPNSHKVVKIGSYTGNGAASRTVTMAPASGLRPLFAIVVPANSGDVIRRDPSHTGTTSTTHAGGLNGSTGIISGGIDEFTVGSALNVNGVVYNWFVLLGSATAGNNGWSINGEFIYVEPEYDGTITEPSDTFDPDDPGDPDPDPDPDPGPGDGDDCEAGTVCVEATTRMVNLALLKIGVQHFLEDYCTEDVKEAQIARQVFETAVRYTLRMFPWPFATKYAALALTATQPSSANEDWTYAYRVPSDCIYPRRLVVTRNRALEPNGPPFMLSSDTSGGILFSNQANAQLEYTARPTCVSYVADALFTEAFTWKLGAEMAPGLSRMTEVVVHCLEQFKSAIEKAESDIKPGVPGKVPGVDGADLDTTAPHIAANLAVMNRALLRIGARTIANYTTDQSREAIAIRLVFEDELQATLRDFPWAFATVYVEPTLVDGAFNDPVNLDWIFSYRAPTDCVMVRRLVTARGRKYEPNPDAFRMGRDATGGLIYANNDEVTIEYTARFAGAVARSDAKFRDALAWRLAAAVAPSLAQVDPEAPSQHGRGPEMPQQAEQRNARKDNKAAMRFRVGQYAWAKYLEALSDASTADANEKQEEKQGDADWHLDRG